MRRVARIIGVLFVAILLPLLAFAQAQIAGTVKDTSGAVLPGVTVEAASPVLIEKTRSVVTDGTGQYKIVDLRPGTYTVTFSLPGFNSIKRDGIELTGNFVAAVSVEMKVGAVEETITVTGESPVVDVQSTTKQRVMSEAEVAALPTGRAYYTLGVLVPGVNSSSKDVGGALGDTMGSLTAHGGRTGDQRILQNGLNVMTLQTAGGNVGGMVPNTSAAQEVAIDTSGASAERQTGGVAVNLIARDGGNTLKGSTFVTFANESMSGDNLSQRVQDLGLTRANSLLKNWDVNPGFGGPIKKDKIWFYYTVRYQGAYNYAAGMYANANAYNPNLWTYVPDTSRPALAQHGIWKDSDLRLTWQANAKNKFAGTWDQQWYCRCPNGIGATVSPEASNDRRFPTQQLLHGEWSAPLTNKVLVEFVGVHRTERWGNMDIRPEDAGGSFNSIPSMSITPGQLASYHSLIGVTEQSSGLQYHGPVNGAGQNSFNNNWVPSYHYRGAVSYITGAHAFKFGYQDAIGYLRNAVYDYVPYKYRFNNGVPNQITLFTTPYEVKHDQNHDLGLFAQDRWTRNRLTVNAGIRFDYFASSYPEQHMGPGILFPNRSFDFAAEDNLNWKDITPRVGVVFDPTGNGRTAIKGSINKYVAGQALGGLGSNTNPILRLALTATRTWNDVNGNFVPDCNVLQTTANGECAAISNTSFGTNVSNQVTDTALRQGWNVRPYNWEGSISVQREVLPRVSVEVGYFRRWFGNFTVTDDLAVSPSDFQQFTFTAPSDPRLPNGGGYPVVALDRIPAAFGRPAQNSQNLSDKYGKYIEHWNGLDFTGSARLQNGVLLQGGISTGHANVDYCEVTAALPELLFQTVGGVNSTLTSPTNCAITEPWLTQVKGVGIYTVPKVAVQVSGTFQSIPGPQRNAVYNVTSAQAALSLGRPLSAGATSNVPVNLLDTALPIGGSTGGSVYGDRLNQIDLRFGKIVRVGKTRTNVSLDLFNVTNQDTVLTENANYATLWRPQTLLQARLIKISAQFDF